MITTSCPGIATSNLGIVSKSRIHIHSSPFKLPHLRGSHFLNSTRQRRPSTTTSYKRDIPRTIFGVTTLVSSFDDNNNFYPSSVLIAPSINWLLYILSFVIDGQISFWGKEVLISFPQEGVCTSMTIQPPPGRPTLWPPNACYEKQRTLQVPHS